MKLRCLWDNVLVRVDRSVKEKLSPGGIVMPETRKGGFRIQGDVIATGPGAPYFDDHKWWTKPMSVKVGDRITFEISSGTIYPQDDGSEFILLVERQVTGIFPSAAEIRAEEDSRDLIFALSNPALPLAISEPKFEETDSHHLSRIKAYLHDHPPTTAAKLMEQPCSCGTLGPHSTEAHEAAVIAAHDAKDAERRS